MIGRVRRPGLGNTDTTWPGFVDALSSLLLVLIFLLSMFVLAQFFLGQTISGKDEALAELRTQVAQLGNLLRLEQEAAESLRGNVSRLSSSLETANKDRDTLSQQLVSLRSDLEAREAAVARLTGERAALLADLEGLSAQYGLSEQALEAERSLSARAQAQVSALEANVAALQDQLARLEAALQVQEEKDRRDQTIIVDLGRRLNNALAGKVEELAGYRSEFFGRLKELLADRPEIRVEGDRFVFQSELLFSSGSADLGLQGQIELRKFAETLIDISRQIPEDLNWVLRVDGHTDRNPISTSRFRSNWDLSAARAIAVVRFLIAMGVPPERLAATGFGEYQPIDTADTPAAYTRNRRIEMRLTQR